MEVDIRDNLKSVITDKGFIQATIAHKANLSPSKFSAILNKSRKLEANELFAICEAIGMSPTDLRNYPKISV
ncbi:MAG TPA: helix-turn-helix domain-containing protein [Candidatus Eisenbergiella merdipullorum]|uniref:Helix-turn-helix domain-containing protein n=1 Tax=Candidatus Eisenbergiella merdipullorum TaxID=2838553 RepID=A0A9D2KYP8_9FIRM|nr:helix-turn-helix domain-containing protein [Candidatus Eisenbergiella merdipullorum]